MSAEQTERDALLLKRVAVIRVVSALRQYRALTKTLKERRWNDGALDGATTFSFFDAVTEVEEALGEES